MVNFDSYYRVKGYRGIAFSLLGYAIKVIPGNCCIDDEGYEFEEEPESVEDHDYVRAVMVGDDKIHIISVNDLTSLNGDEFCHGCGQIGCRC